MPTPPVTWGVVRTVGSQSTVIKVLINFVRFIHGLTLPGYDHISTYHQACAYWATELVWGNAHAVDRPAVGRSKLPRFHPILGLVNACKVRREALYQTFTAHLP